MPNAVIIGVLIVGGIIVLAFLFIIGQYLSLWYQALVAGIQLSLIELMMLRFRRIDPKVIVHNLIAARRAGLDLSMEQLEIHYLAGGSVSNVVQALIIAVQTGIDLTWEQAMAIDLAGRDIVDEVRSSIDPHETA